MAGSLDNRALSSRYLSKMLLEEFGIHCCKSSICEIRRENGLKYEYSRKTELLTPYRIWFRGFWTWATLRQHLFKTVWVITDECMIVADPIRKKIWMFPGETSECVRQGYQGHSAIRVMFWAAIAPGFKSRLMFFPEHVTAQTYQDMLRESGIFPQLQAAFPEGYIFQQDNAPAHKAHATLQFLAQHATVLPEGFAWPPYSPDLSPIEQLWSLLKRKIDMTRVNSKEDLIREGCFAWDNIDQSIVDNHAVSLPARVMAVCRLGGAALAGHQDLVHLFHEKGLAAWDEAEQLIGAHDVPQDWADHAQDLLYDLLEQPSLGDMSLEEQQQRFTYFQEAWEEHKKLLPVKKFR
jgi:hypothetical protein